MRESFVVRCGMYSGRYYTVTGALGHVEHVLRGTDKRFADIDIECDGEVVRTLEAQLDKRNRLVIRPAC